MSSIIYNKAFEVDLSHNFYVTDNQFQINKQLDIVPTAECEQLMSKGHMRGIRTGTGVDVFFKAYKDSSTMTPTIKPLVELSGELTFMFVVSIKDAADEFLNITNLNQGGTYKSGNILFLDASLPPSMPPPSTTPLAVDLSASLISQLRPSSFTYTFLPNTVTLQDDLVVNVYPEGSMTSVLTIDPVLVNPATGIYSVEINLSKQPKGIYTIIATDPSNGDAVEHTAKIYVDTDLAREKVFALLRIKYTDPDYFYKGLPDTISYLFQNRQVLWRYYIAIKDPGTFFTGGNSLKVYDNPSNTYTFLPASGTPINGFSLAGHNYVVAFTSQQNIPFKETAIKTFQLQKFSDSSVILDILPNAAVLGVDSNRLDPGDFANAAAEIFIFLDTL